MIRYFEKISSYDSVNIKEFYKIDFTNNVKIENFDAGNNTFFY